MIANFHNSTTVEYNNLIGIFHRGQAMSHNRPSLIEIIKIFNDSSLIFRIKSISCFIKKQLHPQLQLHPSDICIVATRLFEFELLFEFEFELEV